GLTGNTIFSKSVLGTVFQYNEGYLNQSPDFDGSLYDADLMSPGTVWQYSYSHDNNHGLMWYCTDPRDTGVVVRYNISQNDKGYLVNINYPFTSSSIYNNVFYIGQNTSPIIMREVANTHNYSFQNNIIYNNSTTSKYIMGAPGNVRLIDYNIFYGNHPAGEPADARKITTDPLFVNPGTATTGLASVGGYKLKAGSPALGSGKLISNNGGKDYFGNPVSSTAAPHRGFFNGAVAPAPPAADFSMSTPSVCAGGSITFTSTSSGIVSSYSWDFGAGATPATATGSGPYTVSYNAAGSKTITLTASNSGGSSAKAKPATVNALPATSSITGSNTVSCNAAGVSYSVTNTSASVYNWTVPAGAVITAGQNTNAITVKFGTSSGNITVKETNGAGCAGNTVSVPVSVNCSSTITLNAKGDAYVRDGASAAITYGTSDATHLVTKNTGVTNDGYNRETYLSFDISGISGTISSVTLKLYGALGSGVDPVNVAAYPVANTSWAEGTISWNNKPAVSGAALASASVSDATGRYYTWDITNYVKNEKALGHTMVSFNLKNTTVQLNGPQTVWNSKEAGINSPQLVVSTGAARSGLADISEAESIKVYPNPAADLVSLSVPSVDYEEIRIVVTDENSAKVKEQTYQAKPGTNEIAINLSSLNPGLYYMTIYRQASNEVKKLVIQR
ncbi:MAG: DNRLRE domain-containing protein, partial [Cytophagaceae bacterium]